MKLLLALFLSMPALAAECRWKICHQGAPGAEVHCPDLWTEGTAAEKDADVQQNATGRYVVQSECPPADTRAAVRPKGKK